MRHSRKLLFLAALCTGLALLVPVTAGAQQPPILVENGLTQPIYNFADAIEQRVWVETELDTDGDGNLDRVVIDVSRPRETSTAGLKVPVILEASPYRSGTWGSVPYHDDYRTISELPQSIFVHPDDQAGPRADLPGTLDNYYVPRGYGVVIAQSVGTAQSDGCPTIGDRAEALSAKAIIDWLNGRARGFDAAGELVAADWSTGSVGMTGGSYNGTIPNMVATTGVEGLKTIVPVVAISDWYDYYRENGLVVAPMPFQGEDADVLFGYVAGQARATSSPCAELMAQMTVDQDRVSGDYNEFWAARNYVGRVNRIKASVFIVDGRNDWNVKPSQWGNWWNQLVRYDVPRKIWLHNGGHGAPAAGSSTYTLPGGQQWNYQTTVHRWFDHWLWNVDNGVMDEPRAIVQRENNQTFAEANWPTVGSELVRFSLTSDAADENGALTTDRINASRQVAQTFVDRGQIVGSTQNTPAGPSLISQPDVFNTDRLVYVSEPLAESVRLSGTPRISIRASVDNRSAANLTAYLVDYGPEGSTSATMVTRGWMDVQNRNSRDRTDPIKRGEVYEFRMNLHPDDYVFAAGRRIGLVIFSTDSGNRNSTNPDNWGFTMLPDPGTQLTVLPGHTRLDLPIVGGLAGVNFTD